jgi:energy-coupling factor transporter ATP-binding protein EcfA2
MTPSHSAIAATGLRKAFGDNVVLDGVDLDVGEGTIFALLGPNGAGKTTIVQILSTLIPADDGEVRVAGHDLARDPTPFARRSASLDSSPRSTTCSPARRTSSSWPTCTVSTARRAAGAQLTCSHASTSSTRLDGRRRPIPAARAAGSTSR